MMKLGDVVKIFLGGENPWCTVVETDEDKIKVCIDSKLYNEFSEHEKAQFLNKELGTVKPMETSHGRVKGDEVWCKKDEEFDIWVPSE